MKEIRKALKKHQKDILSRKNVTGIGIGEKTVNGVPTGEMSLVVFVEKKLPGIRVASKDLIPHVLSNIKTDVIETGVIKALYPGESSGQERTGRYRPAPGGTSIGHHKITAGTLGCLVRKGSNVFILSNNHVLANSNDARKGDPILQPGPYDGGTLTNDKIALLEDFVHIVFEGEPEQPSKCPVVKGLAGFANFYLKVLQRKSRLKAVVSASANLVDAAIAKPIDTRDVSAEILEIGTPVGTAEATLGMEVKKSGRTTDLTTGTIGQINATVKVGYGDKVAIFEDQIIVVGQMSQGGDSGSAVLNERNEVVGLLFAGSDTTTVINRIQNVMSALRVDDVVTG